MTRAYGFPNTNFNLFTDFEEKSNSPKNRGLEFKLSNVECCEVQQSEMKCPPDLKLVVNNFIFYLHVK